MQRKARAWPCMLTRSQSGRAVAVTRVTEHHGRRTPGGDGVIWPTPTQTAAAVAELRHRDDHPQPVRRVYLPKRDGRRRGVSRPTRKDRGRQALHWLARDPVAATTADPHAYGVRQGRSAADAISPCEGDLAKTSSAQWVLEADINAGFDELSHPWRWTHVPMDRVTLGTWLKAGDGEQDGWPPTVTGAPQGGLISPALGNLTWDGLERTLNEKCAPTEKSGKPNQVHLVRYADDFIITSRTKDLRGDEVNPMVERFLAERG